jgi:hypothetical protein
VTKGTGSESLECSNGSVLLLLSGDEASGHGDSIDLAFLDEAWSLTEASEGRCARRWPPGRTGSCG